MSNPVIDADSALVVNETSAALARPRVSTPQGLLAHTMASRFLFLHICLTLVLSALAYGSVHYWALAIFAGGAALAVILWLADGWRLGALRLSKNVLQLPLLGLIGLGLFQLLPLRLQRLKTTWRISTKKQRTRLPFRPSAILQLP